MAAPLAPRDAGGVPLTTAQQKRIQYGPPFVPPDSNALWAAVVQLQNTVNALQFNFNLHQHSALNAAPSTNLDTAAAQAAQNLFTVS